jgi:hypothetical protein
VDTLCATGVPYLTYDTVNATLEVPAHEQGAAGKLVGGNGGGLVLGGGGVGGLTAWYQPPPRFLSTVQKSCKFEDG